MRTNTGEPSLSHPFSIIKPCYLFLAIIRGSNSSGCAVIILTLELLESQIFVIIRHYEQEQKHCKSKGDSNKYYYYYYLQQIKVLAKLQNLMSSHIL